MEGTCVVGILAGLSLFAVGSVANAVSLVVGWRPLRWEPAVMTAILGGLEYCDMIRWQHVGSGQGKILAARANKRIQRRLSSCGREDGYL